MSTKWNLSTEQSDLVMSLSNLIIDVVNANSDLERFRESYAYNVEDEVILVKEVQSAEEEVEDFFLRAIGAIELCSKLHRVDDHEWFETEGAGTKCWQCGTITA